MGFWESKWKGKKLIIGDEYADILEDYIDKAAEELKKKYPEVTKEQFLATWKFCSGYIKIFDKK